MSPEASTRPFLLRRLARAAGAVLTLLVVAWLAVFALVRRPPAQPAPLFLGLERPLVIAHMGGDGIRPGNTLPAFLHAWELGAPMSEMDLHTSADGVIVLIHDDTVGALTDGRGAVREMTAAELAALDAAYHWSPDGGVTFPFRGRGMGVPTLAEVLEALPDAWYNLEIKQTEPSLVVQMCALVREAGIQERTLIASFSSRALREARRECPEVATSAGAWEARLFLVLHHLRLTRAWTPPFQAIQLPPRSRGVQVLSPEIVRSARERGLEVHAWTINEKGDMRRFLAMGVDGLVTDFPDRMLEVMREGS